MARGNENGLPNCLYANGKPESRMCNLVDRLDSLGERGKHRQAEGGVRCETHRSAPASFRYAATNPVPRLRGRECDIAAPVEHAMIPLGVGIRDDDVGGVL